MPGKMGREAIGLIELIRALACVAGGTGSWCLVVRWHPSMFAPAALLIPVLSWYRSSSTDSGWRGTPRGSLPGGFPDVASINCHALPLPRHVAISVPPLRFPCLQLQVMV
jgi:hypothetical protein